METIFNKGKLRPREEKGLVATRFLTTLLMRPRGYPARECQRPWFVHLGILLTTCDGLSPTLVTEGRHTSTPHLCHFHSSGWELETSQSWPSSFSVLLWVNPQ